jgi:transcriptional regulator with XRE-family HTH domain
MEEPRHRLIKFRESLKLNQKQFAEAINFNQSYVSEIERGKKDITIKLVSKLFEQYQVSTHWLLYGYGNMIIANENTSHVPNDVRKMSRTNEMLTKSGKNQDISITEYRERLDNDPIFRQVHFLRREYSKGKEEEKYETIVNLAYPIYSDFGKVIDYLYPKLNEEINSIFLKIATGKINKNDGFKEIDNFLEYISPVNNWINELYTFTNELLASIIYLFPDVFTEAVEGSSFHTHELAELYRKIIESKENDEVFESYIKQGPHISDKEKQRKFLKMIESRLQEKASRDDN